MSKAETGLTDEQQKIISRLGDGQKMPKILKELKIKQAVCKRWLNTNEEFRRRCDHAIGRSRTPPPVHDPCGGLPHGDYAGPPDELSRRMHQQNLNRLQSLGQQRSALWRSNPLCQQDGSLDELDERIETLEKNLDTYALHQRLASANQPAPEYREGTKGYIREKIDELQRKLNKSDGTEKDEVARQIKELWRQHNREKTP